MFSTVSYIAAAACLFFYGAIMGSENDKQGNIGIVGAIVSAIVFFAAA